MALVPGVAKRKCLPPPAESKPQSTTHTGVFAGISVAKELLGIRGSALAVVLCQTFLTPFDFIFVGHKKCVASENIKLLYFKGTSIGMANCLV
jgi:hypothetical protein